MPLIEPNFDEAQNFAPLESGVYKARIISADVGKSKGGNNMTTPVFEISHNGEEFKRTAYLVVEGKGAGGFESLLRATGFGQYADQIKNGEKAPFNTDDLIGLEVNVQVEQSEYQGRLRDNIVGYLPA